MTVGYELFCERHPLRHQVSHEASIAHSHCHHHAGHRMGQQRHLQCGQLAAHQATAFPELDRIVAIWETQPSRGVVRNEASMANYLDWRAQNQTFEQMGLYRWWTASLTGLDTPERLQGFLVTGNFLDVLGVKPALG